jgi:MFS family permease
MPFMNVYFRNVHGQSDAVIGTIFAWGSAATALGMLIAPVMADRFGKMQVVSGNPGLGDPFSGDFGVCAGFPTSGGGVLHPHCLDEYDHTHLPDLRAGANSAFRAWYGRQFECHGVELRLGVFTGYQRLAAGALRLSACLCRHDDPLCDGGQPVLAVLPAQEGTAPVTA